MQIKFYKNNAENIRIDKSEFLEEVLSLEGTLREGCSVIEPDILVQLTELPQFNYAYIPDFNRYYYVNDIASVRCSAWQISLSVDTLMSFKADILNMKCIIARQENDFNPYIKDDILPLLPERGIHYIDGDIIKQSLDTFFKDSAVDNEVRCYVLCVFDTTGNYTSGTPDGEVTRINFNNRTVNPHLAMSPYTNMTACWALNHTELEHFGREISNYDFGSIIFGTKAEYVLSCMLFPFDVTKGQGVVEKIYINGREMNTTGVSLFPKSISRYNDGVTGYTKIEAFKITPYYSGEKNLFLNYPPYSDYKIFLPYYGWVEIDNKYFMSKVDGIDKNYLWVSLNVDYITGQASYRLSVGYAPDSTYTLNETEIDFFSFQLGTGIPLGSNNKSQLINNFMLGSIKTGIEIATFVGTASSQEELDTLNASRRSGKIGKRAQQKASLKRKISTVEEVGRVGNYVIDTVSQPMAYKPISGSSGGFLMYSECYFPFIIQTYPTIDEPVDYAKIYGRPSMKTAVLSTLTGFTKCYDFHLKVFPTATREEIDEIQSMLYEGIIL